jgi:uncharacterized protein
VTEPDSPIFEDQEPQPLHEALSEYYEDKKESEYVSLERLPGPGFFESVGWTFVAMISQVIGSIIAVIVILIVYASASGISADQLQGKLREPEFMKFLMTNYAGLNLGIIMGTFIVTILGIVLIRLGSHRRRAIPLQLPSSWHVLLTFLWVLPLSVLCGQLGMYAGVGWEMLAEQIPSIRGMDELNIMESIGEVIAGMPHWLVYLLIAVCPAVSEELLFRVLIGRGLVARHGVFVGVGLTTILFAAVHLHPVHIIALLPLSVAIHVSYLASRSIWTPMLAHFLNNSLAVSVVLNMDTDAAADAAALEGFLPWWATLAAALLSLMIGWVYWQSRLTWSDDDQNTMPEPFVSADRDKTDDAFQLRWRYPPVQTLMALVFSMCFFVAAMAMFAQQNAG